ncbi:hypothetical protein P3X46_012183 [Hevea brasiliensis]|uniref:GCF C-terminal domain-containing protein n=1 Tax=Hevea brasiliensis TaxID=3981 RepID=A0ABQ9MBT4_HEVBR|nr:hypothetical protein P3X46_012183 [Hevea brasiliensis]
MVEAEEEDQTKFIESQAPETGSQIQKCIESLSKSPEVLQALQNITQANQAQKGKSTKPISKNQEKGESSSQKTLSQNFQNISQAHEILQIDFQTNVSQRNSSQIVLSQTKLKKKSSEWITKTHFQNVLIIEDEFLHQDASMAISKAFTKGWYYKPWDLSKTQAYYQAILEFTGSAKFKHFYLKENHADPTYSTCHIQNILNPSDWGQDLTKPKIFPLSFQNKIDHCQHFNYWDYQQAWYNTFLIQNHKNSHSLLFYFQKTFDPSKTPSWFAQWWKYFGALPEILTPEISESLNLFKTHYKPSPKEKRFPPLLLFSSKFFLPWVLIWFFEFRPQDGLNTIIRRFKVKWWDSFNIPETITNQGVKTWLKGKNLLPQTPIQNFSNQLFLAQRSHAMARLAGAKNDEEYFAIMEQLLQNRTNSSAANSDSEPIIDLGDDDEEGCGTSSQIQNLL